MEYDRSRYVAPGVPIVSEGLLQNAGGSLMRDFNFNDLKTKIKSENPFLNSALEYLLRIYSHEAAENDILVRAVKTFMYSASLTHNLLAEANTNKFTESGLPYMSRLDSFGLTLKRILFMGTTYDFDKFRRLNRSLYDLLSSDGAVSILLAPFMNVDMDIREFSPEAIQTEFKKRGKDFIETAKRCGPDIVYGLLEEQNKDYRLEDEIRI